jgi:ligand-binding sensor domain-containing protein
MTRTLLLCTIFLALTLVITPCNGQIKQDLSKEKASEPKITTEIQLNLLKPKGSQKGGSIGSSLQDKKGNLWFGTSEGLYKYDGKSFSLFTVNNGLNSNWVWCMLEDKDGRIWIGTEAGLCLYDGKTFTPIQIPLRKNLPPNKHRNTHTVFSIMQDKSSKLWFATIDGVYIYDGKSFTPFIIKEGGGGFMSSNHNVEYMLEDKRGDIWLGGRVNEGVFRYDGKTITNLKVNEKKEFNWAWPALQDKQGNIWFSNWTGAYRYDGKSFIKMDDLSTGPVTRVIEDKKGNLWFGGGYRGICRYDGKSFTCFTTKDGLIHNDVWSILEDKAGNLWIGTRNTGLSRYNGKTFANFSVNSAFFPINK